MLTNISAKACPTWSIPVSTHCSAPRTVQWLVYLSVFILFSCFPATLLAGHDDPASWKQAQEALAGDRPGFVVWESNRTGRWRIFYRNLDGTGLKQLTPDEKDRDHYCPHLSPDGRYLLYLSFPKNRNTYGKMNNLDAPLYVMEIDEGKPIKLVDRARAYFEDRAAMWIDNDSFIYIDGEGFTCEFDLTTRKSKRLSDKGDSDSGWITNVQKTYATDGRPYFSPFQKDAGKIDSTDKFGGCQPYFTRDGKWGYWMAGAGGPINRVELSTRQVTPILNRNDDRLPEQQRYLYFPMISSNQKLLAFGASRNQHDHFKSDYDIFIIPIDAATLMPTGQPVRYTFDKANDRFPDVYQGAHQLGTHQVEAPHKIEIIPPGPREHYQWQISGKNVSAGTTLIYRFASPGRYVITASHAEKTLSGIVEVEATQKPSVDQLWQVNGNTIKAIFSEPVAVSADNLILRSSTAKLKNIVLDEEKRLATLTIEGELGSSDQVIFNGVRDLAQEPNLMLRTALPIERINWPRSREGLVFAWQSGKPGQVLQDDQGKSVTATATPRGRARYDQHYRMLVDGGSYLFPKEVSDRLLKDCQKSHELTLRATIHPAELNQSGPARILSFSANASSRNFTLGQEGSNYILRLRTPRTGNNGTNPSTTITRVDLNQPVTLAITYKEGMMTAYVDGKKVMTSQSVAGNFSNWEGHRLIVGDELDGGRNWKGTVEGVAIYSRALSEEEVVQDHEAWQAAMAGRVEPEPLVATCLVTAVSDPPTLESIKPYKQALAMVEYEVLEVHEGKEKSKKLRVAQWAILDGKALKQPKVGDKVRLTLTPLDANPQIKTDVLEDTLELALDLPEYFTNEVEE